MDDPLPTNSKTPVLTVRGPTMTPGEQWYVSWNNMNIPVGRNIIEAFGVLCQCYDAFGTACAPTDKQFLLFFSAIIFDVLPISTTGEKFVRSLDD